MSWDKGRGVRSFIVWPEREEVDKYIYTPGIHGLELAKALVEGRVLGMKCSDGKVYVPPKTFCPDMSQGELVEVKGPWRLQYYTVVYEDLYGNRLDKPIVVGVIKPEDASNGMIHIVNVDPSKVAVGMELKPVFKPKDQRKGTVLDIDHFEPA